MAKSIKISAGERRKILSRSFSSIPIEYQFRAYTVDDGEIDGEIEIRRRQLIFPAVVERIPLQKENTLVAGYWDTFVSAYVEANQDLIIEGSQRSFKYFWLIILIASIVVLASVLLMIFSL